MVPFDGELSVYAIGVKKVLESGSYYFKSGENSMLGNLDAFWR